jgi:hypothetical protein
LSAGERRGERGTVLLVDAVEQRQQPVMEDVEEVGRRGVLATQPLEDRFGEGRGQRAVEAAGAEKRHGHARNCMLAGDGELANLARREAQIVRRAKADDVRGCRRLAASGPCRRQRARAQLEEAHRLEELEPVGLREQFSLDADSAPPAVVRHRLNRSVSRLVPTRHSGCIIG